MLSSRATRELCELYSDFVSETSTDDELRIILDVSMMPSATPIVYIERESKSEMIGDKTGHYHHYQTHLTKEEGIKFLKELLQIGK